jgi:hypothetical protein
VDRARLDIRDPELALDDVKADVVVMVVRLV